LDAGSIPASFDYDANPEMGRLMGKNDGELQTVMGLSADAFYNVISQVGNYDEIYSKNLNPVGLYREGSANAPWTEGGLIYAPVLTALDDIPALAITDDDATRLRRGQKIAVDPSTSDSDADDVVMTALYQGQLVAMVQRRGGTASPIRVFNL
jgi:tRNA U55 pseudouridine synthase TruB